ncbi:PH domain-containing protein, partial [Streptomyces sp. SID4931]
MHDIEYIPAQKRTWWTWAGVATVLALYTLYASTVGRRPDTSIGSLLVALGWMAIPAAPWLAWMALGRTRINTDGIQVVRPLRSRTARWD